MKHPQITISELIVVVVITAIGLAAIRSGSPSWAGAMFSITFFAIICAILGIALGRGMRRVYWLGFAVLGWSYLVLIFIPWLHTNVGQFLLAPNLFAHLEEILHPEPGPRSGLQSNPAGILGSIMTSGGFMGDRNSGSVEDLTDFVRIGTAMEALLWAFLGGRVACYFASGRDQAETPVAAPAATRPESGG
jgi:hypothetical protein